MLDDAARLAKFSELTEESIVKLKLADWQVLHFRRLRQMLNLRASPRACEQYPILASGRSVGTGPLAWKPTDAEIVQAAYDVVQTIDGLLDKLKQPHADGPEAPHWVWLGGKQHRIGEGRAKLSWELLNYFWDRNSATYEELQGPGMPWQNDVEDPTIPTAVNRFNNEVPPALPWRLGTKGRTVYKEDRKPNS